MPNTTKAALEESLKRLLLKKPLDKITITDITTDCWISRMAFYYHFKDKFDLVNWIFDVEYLSHVQLGVDLIGWDSVLHLCDYFYENKDFYRKVMKVEDQNSFINHFRDIVSPLMEEDIREILGEKTSSQNDKPAEQVVQDYESFKPIGRNPKNDIPACGVAFRAWLCKA